MNQHALQLKKENMMKDEIAKTITNKRVSHTSKSSSGSLKYKKQHHYENHHRHGHNLVKLVHQHNLENSHRKMSSSSLSSTSNKTTSHNSHIIKHVSNSDKEINSKHVGKDTLMNNQLKVGDTVDFANAHKSFFAEKR